MAHRPRVMLSQLHNFKMTSALELIAEKVPTKFQMLTGLVVLFRLCGGKADGCDCSDASSDVSSTELLSLGWEGSRTFSRARSIAFAPDVEEISSDVEPILILSTDAKRAELDMTELEEVGEIVRHADDEGSVLMDIEPSQTAKTHSSTLRSWPLSHVELELGCRRNGGPFQRGYVGCCEDEESDSQTIAFEASVCCCSTWVWHVQHDVVQKLILTTRRVDGGSWQQVAKRCRAKRCTSEFARQLGICCSISPSLKVARQTKRNKKLVLLLEKQRLLGCHCWPRSQSDACDTSGVTAVPCRKRDRRNCFFTTDSSLRTCLDMCKRWSQTRTENLPHLHDASWHLALTLAFTRLHAHTHARGPTCSQGTLVKGVGLGSDP